MLFSFPEPGFALEIRVTKTHKLVRVSRQSGGAWTENSRFLISHEEWRNDTNKLKVYLEQEGHPEIFDELEADKTTALDLLKTLTEVKNYVNYEAVDLFFGEQVFRMEKKNFIDPEHFYIWYMARFHHLLDITKEDWQSFVSTVLSQAKVQDGIDPLAPPIIENLLESFRHSQIHTSFCPDIEAALEHGGDMSFFVRDDANPEIFYVPVRTVNGIAKRLKESQKSIRKYLKPILITQDQVIKRAGSRLSRFWALDYRRMYLFDPSLSGTLEKIINCKEEENGNHRR